MDSTQLPVFKLPQKANHVQDKRFENTAAGRIKKFSLIFQNKLLLKLKILKIYQIFLVYVFLVYIVCLY